MQIANINLREFKAALEEAQDRHLQIFLYEGMQFYTRYAEYLLDHLETRYGVIK